MSKIDKFIKSRLNNEATESIEKGAEGMRGGKVVGHTSSGNPIYSSEKHTAHAKYSKDEKVQVKTKHKKLLSKLKSKFKTITNKKTKEQTSATKEARKVDAEKSINTENDMKKSQIVEKYMDLVKSGEMTLEDVKKALAAGYETSSEKTPQQLEAEAKEAAAQVEADEAKKEIVFAPGLFNKNFTLGSTLTQTSTGNAITNVKPSADDYVKNAGPKKMITTDENGNKK